MQRGGGMGPGMMHRMGPMQQQMGNRPPPPEYGMNTQVY